MRGMLDFSDKEAVLKFISENGVKILNLCHVPEEGKLKTVSFSTTEKDRISEVLDYGERVDGSSLFSYIEPGKSDIYISPQIKAAFMNPFSALPTLNILCDYLGDDGKPLDIAPKTVLTRAEQKLQISSGISLKALAELEFYIIARQQTELLFAGAPDRNYHDSSPFSKFEDIRNEILSILGTMGISTKYGHSEVGRINGKDATIMEQHEIEFTPQNLTDMAETVAVAKWVVRNTCMRHGLSASFIPKIDLRHAGNGMHIHLCGLKHGRNIIADQSGNLSNDSLRMIGGILSFAPSLAAFGNPTPVSYLRFIARKEAPMHICWSARNRLALIRIPLWWKFKKEIHGSESCRETFEYRAPDAFADPYLLLAGLALAVNYGLENSAESLRIAEDLHAESVKKEEKRFKLLPRSCSDAAKNLARNREHYEDKGIFPTRLVDGTIHRLEGFDDQNLWKELLGRPEELRKMLMEYIDYG